MGKMIEHIALENGTLSEPYRFIQKGEKVLLTEDETEFYKKSWLRPTKEGQKILATPPDFPGVRVSGANGVEALKSFTEARNMNPASEAYNAQMKTIVEAEKANDAAMDETKSDEAQGTGNIDPLA